MPAEAAADPRAEAEAALLERWRETAADGLLRRWHDADAARKRARERIIAAEADHRAADARVRHLSGLVRAAGIATCGGCERPVGDAEDLIDSLCPACLGTHEGAA
jgi:hypothetical protein